MTEQFCFFCVYLHCSPHASPERWHTHSRTAWSRSPPPPCHSPWLAGLCKCPLSHSPLPCYTQWSSSWQSSRCTLPPTKLIMKILDDISWDAMRSPVQSCRWWSVISGTSCCTSGHRSPHSPTPAAPPSPPSAHTCNGTLSTMKSICQ